MAKKFRWIANDNVIDISDFYDKLPDAIKDMIKTAEKADEENDMGAFMSISDAIENWSKMLVPDVLNVHQWDMIAKSICFRIEGRNYAANI